MANEKNMKEVTKKLTREESPFSDSISERYYRLLLVSLIRPEYYKRLIADLQILLSNHFNQDGFMKKVFPFTSYSFLNSKATSFIYRRFVLLTFIFFINSDIIKIEKNDCAHMNGYPKSWDIKNFKTKTFNDLSNKELLKLLRDEGPEERFALDTEHKDSELILKKLGTIKYGTKLYHIVFFQNYWGNARVTERLIFISENLHYLGDYYITGHPRPRIFKNSIRFGSYKLPLNKNCLVKEILLEGEIHSFDFILNSKYKR